MKRIKRLMSGNMIQIVSPAFWLDEEVLFSVKTSLVNRGFRVQISDQSFHRNGAFAGSDRDRAAAMNAAFLNEEVTAIICARGGYGTLRMAEFLDFAAIRENPKILVGYSDITPLLNFISCHYGFPTFHGPMITDFRDEAGELRMTDILHLLSGSEATIAQYIPKNDHVIRSGHTIGLVFGGSLTSIDNCIGTDFELLMNNSVLLLEDIGEPPYKIDRYLLHLRKVGYFNHARAIILGEMMETSGASRPFGRLEVDIYREYFGGIDGSGPILMGAPFGHMPGKRTIPIGAPLDINVTTDRIHIRLASEIFL